MIGNLYNSIQESSLNLYFQIYGFSDDRDKYRAFKNGNLSSFYDGDDIGFNVLMVLEKLGFSSDEIGTYVYKNLIKEIVYMINAGTDEKVIINSLTNKYSQLYLDLAYESDIGTQTLHDYIEQSYSNIDVKKTDNELHEHIYGEYHILNYGIDAYLIANYINNTFNLYKNDTKARILSGK